MIRAVIYLLIAPIGGLGMILVEFADYVERRLYPPREPSRRRTPNDHP